MDAKNDIITTPLVSIITPSFNQGEFIEETILSVLKQDYSNIEFIIIDGGSTDNTLEIINKYKSQISYFISEKDKGQTDAIVKGFNLAKGKYITWLCSDDLIEPSMIKTSIDFMETDQEIVMTYGDRIRYDAKSNMIGYHRYCAFRPWLLEWGFSIPQETTLIRKSAYDETSGLDTSLKMAMDFDLFCILSKKGTIKHIPSFLGRFRSHSANKSTIFNNEILSTGFESGAPLEFSKVYYKHFNKSFPLFKWKRTSLLNDLLALFDRRGKEYKKDLSRALNLRS